MAPSARKIIIRGRKTRQLTLGEKVKLIEKKTKYNVSNSALADEYSISEQAVGRILKLKDKILAALTSGRSSRAKQVRHDLEYPEIDQYCLDLLKAAREQKYPLRPFMLREYAVIKARELGWEGFLGSQGWLDKWCTRHKVRFVTLHGEAGSVDLGAVDQWLHVDLPTVLENIDPANVYNTDETGVSWRELGNKTLVIGTEEVRGTKLVKDRFTVMLTCSATGEMLPVKIVAFSKNPHSFRRNGWRDVTVEKNGFHYYSNKTAWVKRDTFGPWLDHLNEQMTKERRHIILLADNFSGHQVGSRSNVQLVFLPPNTTSRLQPLDAGIIKSFKDYFKRNMAKAMLEAITKKKSASDFSKSIEIYDATVWVLKAAKSVKKSTMVNCFRHCGIGSPEIVTEAVDTVENVDNTGMSAEVLESVDEIVRFDEDDSRILD